MNSPLKCGEFIPIFTEPAGAPVLTSSSLSNHIPYHVWQVHTIYRNCYRRIAAYIISKQALNIV